MKHLWRKLPHHTLIATVLSLAVIACVIYFTHGSLATVIPLSALFASIPMSLAFGLQTLMQGLIAGRTLQAERRFSEGDLLTINGITGTIEVIGLRATELRDKDGNLVVVPNQVILTTVFTVKKGKPCSTSSIHLHRPSSG